MQAQSSTPTFGDSRLPPRFWAKVRIGSVPADRPDLGPCWEWTAAQNDQGYGFFRVGSRTDGTNRLVRAHRLAYETLIGPIPEGLESDHLCRNRPCANPGHIEPVTSALNNHRGVRAQNKGEANAFAKLNEDEVRTIRALRGRFSQRALAKRFGWGKRKSAASSGAKHGLTSSDRSYPRGIRHRASVYLNQGRRMDFVMASVGVVRDPDTRHADPLAVPGQGDAISVQRYDLDVQAAGFEHIVRGVQ